ncbi:hypothetical protein D0B54_02155 [Solimonas sp. K1W22B-7]|uniref:hypothetical protein n=1 Tax=Solimonas sp. K1W22B-7 TaxID=2303331 RepID=UPI000E335B92|nr:hypothetical protein [Solimonas sp. K1W22B-7]AXQ27552.1 hypothetical protein D0B54_02155 [Solimonas sp. K1W22B-7]
MEYLIGIALALAVALGARWIGFDRDRAFYPTVLIVIASYYALFAVMGGSLSALAVESVALGGFALLAIAGFKLSPWIVVAALAGHGVFDWLHPGLIDNPGVPAWWPGFCLGYDLAAAGFLSWNIRQARGRRLRMD